MKVCEDPRAEGNVFNGLEIGRREGKEVPLLHRHRHLSLVCSVEGL